ncbi:MAG TPA: SAP domain-containing protein [Aeromicrobium sp.]|nr:SAP domain-containing protein [Aeromicrobium sp.]HKY59205.1 SAP domain-containing protein [Aeromicrobium sp.]
MRYRYSNGAVVDAPEEKAESLRRVGFSPIDESEVAEAEGYAAMKVADLKAEIESRNEDRDEESLLSAEGKKADLVATLEADDASKSE